MVNGRTVVSSMTIAELKPGQSALVSRVGGEGALRQHFLDMGVIPGAALTVVKLAPMGDPMELRIHGYELTLRLDDAARIEVWFRDQQGKKRKLAEKIYGVEGWMR